mmetsp:Transcript_2689/g.4017  ORF Transcript_2689/g.4017 Transcript_2689/m.4017 type:complete len:135 (-) Transcript_2689:70-474(-)|eukprot:CAMPEP_0171462920 /NCGR_PEP_ID=MMETSP0945-20130129/6778_1 /TAXON_ID=109269 /ORGANISM="Vaucheria litorea, Strain CCMP2940" /LENGTH=134 /DNA_ID=CAMNT_0011989569 /DNA_START=200 /DNA_END=604 /DNA_ORIENTATION=+
MGRSSRSSGRSRAPVRAPPPKAKPTQTQTAPAQRNEGGGGLLSGMASTIAQGFAFGTGSAVAHRAVGAVANSFGGSEQAPQAAASNEHSQKSFNCDTDQERFFNCLKQNSGDAANCQFLYESLQSCQADARQFA